MLRRSLNSSLTQIISLLNYYCLYFTIMFMKVMAFSAKQLRLRYIHRDVSWLAFDRRVLSLAENKKLPLLERAKFLAIAANNLVEFLEVRFAENALLSLIDDHKHHLRDKFGYTPKKNAQTVNKLIAEGYHTTQSIYEDMYAVYSRLLEDLQERNIRIIDLPAADQSQRSSLQDYMRHTLHPLLSPESVKKHSPEQVYSRELAFICQNQNGHKQVVSLPHGEPRLKKLQDNTNYHTFILQDTLVRTHLHDVLSAYNDFFAICELRIFRNNNIWLTGDQDQYVELEKKLKERQLARAVWLEYLDLDSSVGEKALIQDIADIVKVPKAFRHGLAPVLDLSFLFSLVKQVSLPELKYQSFAVRQIPQKNQELFSRIRQQDILLHYPYDSFEPVIDFFETAALDPQVRAIRSTIYRVSKDSRIIEALKQAAQNGKEVTVLVELKARYDEAQNLKWTRELEASGCRVMHSPVALKVHAKFAMVLREEAEHIRPYVYLATGNLNEETAQIYTDIGYFISVDNGLAAAFVDFFNAIASDCTEPQDNDRLFVGKQIKNKLLSRIDEEIAVAKAGGHGEILAKMNGLEDTEIIEKLYAASQAGVKIRLIVRGVCCLIPGIKGLSENIEVRSVLGRFLEHQRIFVFGNSDNIRTKDIFFSSADWMSRNMERRWELMFSVQDKEAKQSLYDIVNSSFFLDAPQDFFLEENNTGLTE